MAKDYVLRSVPKYGQLPSYLESDPIVCDSTDWSFIDRPEKARVYSLNQAMHLQRYYHFQYPSNKVDLVDLETVEKNGW